MNRRDFHRTVAQTAAAFAALPGLPSLLAARDLLDPAQQDPMAQTMARFVEDLSGGDPRIREMIAPARPRQIGMLAYPGMFPLDLLGPKIVFGDLLQTQVHIVAKSRQPVPAGRGVQLQPHFTLADCPEHLDVLFVPGGGMPTAALMQDQEVLEFLQHQARTARYITSVCTGSMVLAAAGLLKGYRATSHWLTRDLLARMGATPVRARVVEDRNRITGAGVTAGLDFAFVLASRLAGETYAKAEQLNIEYDPDPPFAAGTPEGAGKQVTDALVRMYASTSEMFAANSAAAAKRLG